MIVPFLHRALACAPLVLFVAGAHAQQTDTVPIQSAPQFQLPGLSSVPASPGNSPAKAPDIPGPATPDVQDEIPNPDGNATVAAVADGLTTGLALSTGALEANPLLSPSPMGILTITALKVGLSQYAQTLPEEEKRTALKYTTSFWGGAAVNNLLVAIAAPTPLALVAGVVAGVMAWRHMEKQYSRHDEMVAQRRMKSAPVQVAASEEAPTETQLAATNVLPAAPGADSSGR
jgi:hypothetical protein